MAIPARRMQRRTWTRHVVRELWWSNHFDDLIIGVDDRAALTTFGNAGVFTRVGAKPTLKSQTRVETPRLEDFSLRVKGFRKALREKSNALAEKAFTDVPAVVARRNVLHAIYVKQIANAKRNHFRANERFCAVETVTKKGFDRKISIGMSLKKKIAKSWIFLVYVL